MATRKEVEKTETPEEGGGGAPMRGLDVVADHDGLARLKTELKSTATKLAPITVGNPASAASLAIDQSHLEEFAIAEEKSPDVRYGKPPKGVYFTVLPETGTTVAEWKNRAFYFLLEIEGRDPLIVAPDIAKQKIAEGEDVIRPILIVRYVTMAGEEGLWPLKLDKPEAKKNRFNKSALKVLEEAERGWVRLISAKNHYDYHPSKITLEQRPPKFSDRSYQNLIDIQFKDQVANSLDHEIWNILDQGSDK